MLFGSRFLSCDQYTINPSQLQYQIYENVNRVLICMIQGL